MPKQTKEYSINVPLKIFVDVWMALFKKYYGIHSDISEELRNIDEPYLLLANHMGRYDPFIISSIFKKKPHFISSDAILRDRVIGTLFKGLGAVPKKKGVRDTVVIRDMMKLVKRGDAVSLFPEGTRTWDGKTHPIEPSIAKLIKLLQVPVITCTMEGAYAFDPRWARHLRPADVLLKYRLIISKEECRSLGEEELFDRVSKALSHDDIVYQKAHHIKIRANGRAEYIDRVLFQCPDCESFEGFNSKGNYFTCRSCNESTYVDHTGFFQRKNGGKSRFYDIQEWMYWQNENFKNHIHQKLLLDMKDVLIKDKKLRIERAKGEGRMEKLGIGNIQCNVESLDIILPDETIKLEVDDIASIGPQFNERIELFYKDKAYRFVDTELKVSGLKWELAVNEIWKWKGQEHKQSTYLKA